jgi:flavin-dependent dehydrogenase
LLALPLQPVVVAIAGGIVSRHHRRVSRCRDVVVIGAGPAGAVLARALAAGGAEVLLVDRHSFPRHKVCGGCLGAKTLELLDTIGLGRLPGDLRAVPLERLQLRGWDRGLELPLPGGASVSRYALDASLVDAAVAAGADFRPGAVAELGAGDPAGGSRRVALRSRGEVTEVEAKVVVAACGLGSPLAGRRQSAGRRVAGSLERPPRVAGARIGVARIVSGAPRSYRPGTVHMAIGTRGYVGCVRLENGRLNVAAALDQSFVREVGPGAACRRILAEAGFPPIAGLVSGPWSGTPPLGSRPSRVAGERLFLLGDAAGYPEPFTGEGIGWALAAALSLEPLARQAVNAWKPALGGEWERRHHRQAAAWQRPCRALGWLLRRPLAARLALTAVAAWPRLGEPLVNRLQAGSAASSGGLGPQGATPWP